LATKAKVIAKQLARLPRPTLRRPSEHAGDSSSKRGEAYMKARSYLVTLLACGALSTTVAAADKPKTPVVVGVGLKQNSNTKAAIVTPPPNPAAVPASDKAANTAALAIVAGTGPSISGTGTMRPGSSTGAVGGSTKISGGAIGGNSVHLKHP
jgi:hypothetical protein